MAAVLFFSICTILITWPLAAHLRTSVIGWPGDNWYYVWLIGWFQKAFFELKQNPLLVPLFNSPTGWSLAYAEITFSNVVIALPFSLMGGPVLGYNLVLLVSFVLSGFVVYRWIMSLTRSTAAGLVGGALFAFGPYRMAHAYGHLPLMGTQWLAVYFAGLYYLLQQRSVSWKYAGITGIGLGLAALSSLYYLFDV